MAPLKRHQKTLAVMQPFVQKPAMKIPQPLIFLRHGLTTWNEEQRYQGSTETELSSGGRDGMKRQAALLKDILKTGTLNTEEITLVSSPMVRARQSAEIIANQLGFGPSSISIEPRLRELSMGRWEGLTSQQVKDTHYHERKGRKSDRWHFAADGGGERMAQRAPVIRQAVAELKSHSIVVTHSVVIRILLHEIGSWSKHDAASADIPHDGLYLYEKSQLRLIGEDGVSSL